VKSEFIRQEHKRRKAEYKNDDTVYDFLLSMNKELSRKEIYKPSGKKYPTIFVFGLPRSGTTLLYQLISYSLDLGYVNNLIARFWLAPLHGIMLSKAVLGDARDGSFVSDYGKSINIAGPHEFSYFWMHWLGIRSIDEMLLFGSNRKDINWKRLKSVISCMQDIFEKGMVFKNNYVANLLKNFSTNFDMPIFIYIERDVRDVALSILKARKSYYDNLDAWWGTYPPEYHSLKTLPFHQQIAGQVTGLIRVYEKQIELIHEDSILRVNYDELCQSPASIIELIIERVNRLYGFPINFINRPPSEFQRTGMRRNLCEDEKKVLKSLRKNFYNNFYSYIDKKEGEPDE